MKLMDMLPIFLVTLLGDAFGSQSWISEEEVNPGDNITLHCDCKRSTGVYTVWYKNCSHENQPTLVMSGKEEMRSEFLHKFHFVNNVSFETYDLVITNVTDSDEGLYYCGTETSQVEDEKFITHKYVRRFGNATRITVASRIPGPHNTPLIGSTCWILLFSLCPLFAVFSSLCTSLLIYHFCRKRGFQGDRQSTETGVKQSLNQDEDVCYAALDIRQPSKRPKRKKQDSEFSTYSAINVSN